MWHNKILYYKPFPFIPLETNEVETFMIKRLSNNQECSSHARLIIFLLLSGKLSV